MRPAIHIWGSLGLTLVSVAYTYLVTWGLDEGIRTIGAKWAHLDWHLSCGAVFALPVLLALQLDLRRQFGEALGIIAVCAVTNPLAVFGPGLFMPFIPPFWVTGAVTAVFLAIVIALIVYRRPPPLWPFLWAALSGALGGLMFEIARENLHRRGCASGEVCVPIEWVLPGYILWQFGLVTACLFYPRADDGETEAG